MTDYPQAQLRRRGLFTWDIEIHINRLTYSPRVAVGTRRHAETVAARALAKERARIDREQRAWTRVTIPDSAPKPQPPKSKGRRR